MTKVTHSYDYVHNCYIVFVNGKFYCTCDVGELSEVEKEIMEEFDDG